MKISLGLNLLLLAALIFALANARKPARQPASDDTGHAAADAVTIAAASVPAPSAPEPEPFRWDQLQSQTNYRTFVANLRAIGCPEATLQDIVRGETGRAFAWERRQLGLDETGTGPWSATSERKLVASLLAVSSAFAVALPGRSGSAEVAGEAGPSATTASVPSQPGALAAPTAYPLFLQNVNWSALGFSPEQAAAIGSARQQFQSAINGPAQSQGNPTSSSPATLDPNVSGSASLSRWQTALQNANDQLRSELGGQAYAAYEQQQYYSWFQPQVIANAGGGNLNINPDAFTVK